MLYLDAGDIEETTVRVSNLTKGVAMHRILTAAGCDVATVGNGAWLRYGMQVITEQADTAGYPLLLANLAPVEGVQPSVLLRAGEWQIGVIGITDPFLRFLGGFDFGIESLEPLPLVRELARELRTRGAELVVLLSHVGYENELPRLRRQDARPGPRRRHRSRDRRSLAHAPTRRRARRRRARRTGRRVRRAPRPHRRHGGRRHRERAARSAGHPAPRGRARRGGGGGAGASRASRRGDRGARRVARLPRSSPRCTASAWAPRSGSPRNS